MLNLLLAWLKSTTKTAVSDGIVEGVVDGIERVTGSPLADLQLTIAAEKPKAIPDDKPAKRRAKKAS